MTENSCLLDVTRLISRSWTGRRSTGIDRVCYAYLARFAGEAQAVVQHAGVFRVLERRDSKHLFALLAGPDRAFRRKLAAFAPRALARASARVDGRGAHYLNVSHTEFDRADHWRWLADCDLLPVYLIHDLIPITHPQFCRERAVERHRGRVLKALLNASGIIVNSRATAAELAAYAGSNSLPPVLAAPIAGARLSVRGRDPSAASRAPYFVCLGTIEPRKNHATLFAVWRALARELGEHTPRLVIAGQWGAGSGEVRSQLKGDALLRRHVTVLDRCPDEDLGDLISGARAVLLPSQAEGFGLPMAEALALGTPVIASDLASFGEIGQGIPDLLDPLDVEAWTGKVCAFIEDSPARLRQIAAMNSFRAPTWADHFAAVDSWLGQLKCRSHQGQTWAIGESQTEVAGTPSGPITTKTAGWTR